MQTRFTLQGFASMALIAAIPFMAADCKKAIDDIIPDVNTEFSLTLNADGSQASTFASDTLDPNSNPDFRDNRAKLAAIELTRLSYEFPTVYTPQRTIYSAKVEFRHIDSTNFTELGTRDTVVLATVGSNKYNLTLNPAGVTKLNGLIKSSLRSIVFQSSYVADNGPVRFIAKLNLSVKLDLL